MWKKTLGAAAIVLIISVAVGSALAVMANKPDSVKPDKDVICHYTSSATNPWNRLVVSWNAINGHFNENGSPIARHEQDLLFEGELALCPTYCGDGTCDANESCSSCAADCGSCGGGGGCTVADVPKSFDIQNATLNDNTLELVWNATTTSATSVNIRYGYKDNQWDFSKLGTPNDGFEAITGLTNGIHYWFQIQGVNSCGTSNWSTSIDPLP